MGWTHQNTQVSVVDLFKQIVSTVSACAKAEIGEEVNFIPATPLHLHHRLSEAASKLKQRFPLIVLVHNFEENFAADKCGGELEELTVWIMNKAFEKDHFFEDRYEKNFKPVIDPIYREFMQVIFDSGFFQFPMNVEDPLTDIEHSVMRRPDWGFYDQNGNRALIAGHEYIDGIELIFDLKLSDDYMKCFIEAVEGGEVKPNF